MFSSFGGSDLNNEIDHFLNLSSNSKKIKKNKIKNLEKLREKFDQRFKTQEECLINNFNNCGDHLQIEDVWKENDNSSGKYLFMNRF